MSPNTDQPPRSSTWSSAPASPACARRSSCRRTARPTSWSSRRARDVGGTWRDNTYPGAACDVPSQLYSFSFAPNPDWSMSFSPQPEIQAYIRRVAERSGVLDRFRFHTALRVTPPGTRTPQRWRVELAGAAGRATVTSTTLVVGAGGLSEPKLPDIDGIEAFQGELFHSARWNHDVDLDRQAGRGHRHRRLGDPDRPRGAEGRRRTSTSTSAPRRTSSPATTGRTAASSGWRCATSRACRSSTAPAIYWGRETYVPGFTLQPKLAAAGQAAGAGQHRQGHLRPRAARAVTPTFEIGCKRILISNTYYPALDSDNVDLVTDRIAKVTGDAIVTADGVERPIDVLVVATGFFTTELPITEHITGRERPHAWPTVARERDGGATRAPPCPASPTCSCSSAPTPGWDTRAWCSSSSRRSTTSATRSAPWGCTATPPSSPRRARTREWNDDLQRRMKRTVWNTGGCSSWYLDDHGRNTIAVAALDLHLPAAAVAASTSRRTT